MTRTFRLSWYPYLRAVGYLLVAEMFGLWPLSAVGHGPVVEFLLGVWWLWPALTLLLGLAARAGTRLELGHERINLLTFGKPWRRLSWQGASGARLLKVGSTIAVLIKIEDGGFRFWRQSGLAIPDEVAKELRQALGPKMDMTLTPPYRSRHGRIWSVEADRIRLSSPEGAFTYVPASLHGVKFLFVEGDDLPVRIHLFPANGDLGLPIGQGVSFFPILAADILRFAKANGVKVVSADLGKNRPRPGRKREEPSAPPRAWEEEGWR